MLKVLERFDSTAGKAVRKEAANSIGSLSRLDGGASGSGRTVTVTVSEDHAVSEDTAESDESGNAEAATE